MKHKFLFIFGIVVAHGALAAGLASQDGSAPPRTARVATCVRAPSAPLHFAPPGELLAYAVTPAEFASEVMDP
jgi:hypothetical protein